jgi:hypothetical protein
MAWAQTYADTFTGTAFTVLETYNAAWVNDLPPGLRISSNGTSCGNGSNSARAYLTGASAPSANQAVEVVLRSGTSPNLQLDEGLIARFTPTGTGFPWTDGTGYLFFIPVSNTVDIHRMDGSGSHTQIAQTSYTPADLDLLRWEIVGSNFDLLKNGSLLLNVTDATYATGAVGISAFSTFDDTTFMSLDNFTAYQQVAGGALPFIMTSLSARASRRR